MRALSSLLALALAAGVTGSCGHAAEHPTRDRSAAGRPDAAPIAPGDGNGVGLGHVRDRLAQLYPDRHTFTLEPRADGGTTAVLELPHEVT